MKFWNKNHWSSQNDPGPHYNYEGSVPPPHGANGPVSNHWKFTIKPWFCWTCFARHTQNLSQKMLILRITFPFIIIIVVESFWVASPSNSGVSTKLACMYLRANSQAYTYTCRPQFSCVTRLAQVPWVNFTYSSSFQLDNVHDSYNQGGVVSIFVGMSKICKLQLLS